MAIIYSQYTVLYWDEINKFRNIDPKIEEVLMKIAKT